jgi:hypothetical protein
VPDPLADPLPLELSETRCVPPRIMVQPPVGERARSFKAVSPGMLPPLGITFGLFVAFTAAQVWNDTEQANVAVNREASALRSVVILAASFPGEPEMRLRALIRRYIEEAATQEWPMMARHTATLSISPGALGEALQLTLALAPSTLGQQTAQREIPTTLESALDARRQRILTSRSEVNLVKWACLVLQAVCALLAIAIVHGDNRLASTITMGIFATGVAASVLLILAHDRPFTGEISVGPQPLLQVMPEADTAAQPSEQSRSPPLQVMPEADTAPQPSEQSRSPPARTSSKPPRRRGR